MRVNSQQQGPCRTPGAVSLDAYAVICNWPTAKLSEAQRCALLRRTLIKPPGA